MTSQPWELSCGSDFTLRKDLTEPIVLSIYIKLISNIVLDILQLRDFLLYLEPLFFPLSVSFKLHLHLMLVNLFRKFRQNKDDPLQFSKCDHVQLFRNYNGYLYISITAS